MGWKNVRDHYGIKHIVHVAKGNLCIGSPLVSRLLEVTPDGKVTPSSIVRGEGEVGRYQRDIEADPATFARLFAEEDRFGETVPVYTWDDTGVIEKRAEEHGFPNVCTDGELQYDNTVFPAREQAVKAALRDARSWAERSAEHVVEAEAELAMRVGRRDAAAERLARYERDNPGY